MIDLFRLTDGDDFIASMKEGCDTFGIKCRNYSFEEYCRGNVNLHVEDEVDTALTIIAHFKKEDGKYFTNLQSGSCPLTGVSTDCYWGDIAIEHWQPVLARLQAYPDFENVVKILNDDPNMIDASQTQLVDAICAFAERCRQEAEKFFELKYPELWDSFDESFEECYSDEVTRWANEDTARAIADKVYSKALYELNKKDGI